MKHLTSFKTAINTVLPMFISKEVQTKGQSKRNFSKTMTYQILKGNFRHIRQNEGNFLF